MPLLRDFVPNFKLESHFRITFAPCYPIPSRLVEHL